MNTENSRNILTAKSKSILTTTEFKKMTKLNSGTKMTKPISQKMTISNLESEGFFFVYHELETSSSKSVWISSTIFALIEIRLALKILSNVTHFSSGDAAIEAVTPIVSGCFFCFCPAFIIEFSIAFLAEITMKSEAMISFNN